MSTKLHDIPNNSLLALTFAQTNAGSATTAGSSADFVSADGQCTALLYASVASQAATPAVTCQFEESTDGTTWTEIDDAAIEHSASTTFNGCISFQRSARYLRGNWDTANTGTRNTVVWLIGQTKKVPV